MPPKRTTTANIQQFRKKKKEMYFIQKLNGKETPPKILQKQAFMPQRYAPVAQNYRPGPSSKQVLKIL